MTRDAGFTLIETLVALAVLAVGAVALMGVVNDHASRIGALEDRIALRWVAENQLAARQLGVALEPEWTRVFDQRFEVSLSERPLTEAGLSETIATAESPRAAVVLRGYTAW